ncbi:MAG TPA: exosortase/archaeosortase family protein [Hanamia sp.]|nr:exosortase/archaeosortase family protein [Hanamia sp.]
MKTLVKQSTIKLLKNPFLIYLLKFGVIFCVLYFGTLAVIGLASPVGWYSPFVDHHMDYVSWLKNSLIDSSKFILSLFSIQTVKVPGFALTYPHGKAVLIAMDCVGYGVYSFWVAFVVANKGGWVRKLIWVVGGLLALWFINTVRITLVLVAINKGWPMPLGIDHHTWFNICAYLLIFVMIWLYDRSKLAD